MYVDYTTNDDGTVTARYLFSGNLFKPTGFNDAYFDEEWGMWMRDEHFPSLDMALQFFKASREASRKMERALIYGEP